MQRPLAKLLIYSEVIKLSMWELCSRHNMHVRCSKQYKMGWGVGSFGGQPAYVALVLERVRFQPGA